MIYSSCSHVYRNKNDLVPIVPIGIVHSLFVVVACFSDGEYTFSIYCVKFVNFLYFPC